MSEEKKQIKIPSKYLVFTGIALLIVIIMALGFFIWRKNPQSQFAQGVSAVIPYPAATVNGTTFVKFHDLKKNVAAIEKFYTSQNFSSVGMRVDFETEEGRMRLKLREKQILEKMIEDKIIENLAKKRGILITDELVNATVDRKLSEFSSKDDVEKSLSELYGWTLAEFKKEIVMPDIYRTELEKYILENEVEKDKAKMKIEKAFERISNQDDFSEIAKEYSEGASAEDGGNVGWISTIRLVPELAEKVTQMSTGEISSVVRSGLGYHIVKVIDKKEGDGQEMANIQQIFVRVENFGQWLEKQKKDYRINVLLKDYSWDKENLKVIFTSEEMRKFENEQKEKIESEFYN